MCLRLDSQLEVSKKYLLTNDWNNHDWKIFNLENGDSLAVSISKKLPVSVQIRRLASDGRISKPHFLDPGCDTHFDSFEKFDELPGNYCFTFACSRKRITYCLDDSKAVNLTSYQPEK